MRIELDYGRGKLAVELPFGCRPTVVSTPAMPLLADPTAAVVAAYTNSRTTSLQQAAVGRRTACIVVCDITRPVPNGLLLPPLVRGLTAAGIALQDICILVATGLHRPCEGDELLEVLGDRWVYESVPTFNHSARNPSELCDLGATPVRRTRVLLNRRFVQADLRIVVGLVEPHFMAGFSGGRKVVAPGIAGHTTIRTFHNAAFMSHPRAASCVLDGNPLHEEQLAIVGMLGEAYAVNAVIDDRRRLAFVNFGEIVASHLDAVDFVRPFVEVAVPRRFHTVVSSAAGYPLDKTYYQTVKGMVGPLDILAPHGDLFIASACEEGIGSKEFAAAQRRLLNRGVDGFLDDIAVKALADIDEWQTQMQTKSMRCGNVHLYSDGLGDEEFALTGVRRVDSLADAIAASMDRHGDTEVAIVPEGPYVVPRVRVPGNDSAD